MYATGPAEFTRWGERGEKSSIRSEPIRFDPIEFERTCSNSQLDPFVIHDPRAGRLRVRASSADRNVQRAIKSIHRLIDRSKNKVKKSERGGKTKTRGRGAAQRDATR